LRRQHPFLSTFGLLLTALLLAGLGIILWRTTAIIHILAALYYATLLR
jgi:hypothetical protein